jgi:hypothetical protein
VESAARPARFPTVPQLLVSALIGISVVFLMFVGREELWGWRLALFGASIGVSIHGTCHVLGWALEERLCTGLRFPRKGVRVVLYLVGGEIGFFAATLVLSTTRLMPFSLRPRDLGLALLINGGMAIAIGLAFSSYAALQRRLRESIEKIKEQEFAEKELALAREIQTRLLPADTQEGAGYGIAARNVPARFVAGDFFDVFRLSTGELGVCVADVSGKGIGASLIMASVKAVLSMMAEGRTSSEALTELNRKLSRELSRREFVALAYARFDPGSGRLVLANAGLPDPYLIRAGGGFETLVAPGPRLPLGARADVAYEALEVSLRPGDRMLLFTDGLPESETSDGEPLGYEAFERLLPRRAASPTAFLDQLFSGVRSSTTPVLGDDWTGLVLEAR